MAVAFPHVADDAEGRDRAIGEQIVAGREGADGTE
jgi:hypothetical protein